MLELLKYLFSPSQYIPHGHCYLWQTPLVWLHITSDALTAIAYFSIPAMLVYFVRKRDDVPYAKVFVLFSAFIVMCGTGHLLDIWTLWHPAYWVSGVERAMTALVSCYTALQLVELLPQFLSLKSPKQLEIINQELEKQIAERKKIEAMLEVRVQERTAELLQANASLEVEIQERIAVEAKLQQVAERERATALVIQRMRQSLNLDNIFTTATQELRQAIQCDRTLIYRFHTNGNGGVVAESVAPDWCTMLPRCNEPFSSQPAIDRSTCVAEEVCKQNTPGKNTFKHNTSESESEQDKVGQKVLLKDIYLQEKQAGMDHPPDCYCEVADMCAANFDLHHLTLLKSLQARAYITVPIFCGNHLWGLLVAYQNAQPRQWQSTEIQMVSQIGNQLGVAVQQAELFAKTQEQAEELKRAKEAADTANRAKTEFLANMSHELRNPLNVILGLTQLLRRDTSLSNLHHQDLQAIERSGEHLLAVINDVLEMSKIEAGQISLHKESFLLIPLLNNLQEMLCYKAQNKGLQLNFEYSSDLPKFIQTDKAKLSQVLINLLGNAIKFTQQGKVTLRVFNLSDCASAQLAAFPSLAAAAPDFVTLGFEVEDTGAGIASWELDRLFKPFQQTQTGLQAVEGTGLGLVISQKYIHSMGGEIAVQSTVDQGSVFSFYIQVDRVDQSLYAKQLTNKPDKILGLAPAQSTRRILIVEDHPVNRFLLVKLLSLPGFELQQAENGQQAIEQWRTWRPHLVLMDMRMPVMNGYEATQKIREQESILLAAHSTARVEPQRTIIIASTASAFEEQRQEMLAIGCDDSIGKPYRKEEIFDKIAHHLRVEYLYDVTVDVTARPRFSSNSLSETSLETSLETSSHENFYDENQGLDRTVLKVMPQAWIQQLHQAALECDDDWIFKLIAEIPTEYCTIAKLLTQLTEQLQLDKIISMASIA